jgi:hypothetical protein
MEGEMSKNTFGHKKAAASEFSQPSLVSPKTPTLANPVRGFGITTDNVIQKATEVSTDTQEISSEQQVIQEKPIGHDISRISFRRPQSQNQLQAKSANTDIKQRQDEVSHENRTGIPDSLKTGLENLSGLDLSGVKVHQNSDKPTQINALAYAQGHDIYLSPGQEKHLPHEGWHVVQQMQGRVQPTLQANNVLINNDNGLEQEADVMGAKASQQTEPQQTIDTTQHSATLQRQASSVAQMTPLAFAGLSAEAWGMAANVVGAISGVGGAAAGTYTAVSRGENAFGSLVLPQNLMSDSDQLKLQQIAQFRIINSYVDRYLQRNPHVREQLSNRVTGTTPTTPTPTPDTNTSGSGQGANPPSPTPELPTGAPTASAIDEAVLDSVKRSVQIDLQSTLERPTNETTDKEFMWGEDNTRGRGAIGQSGTGESVGVTGFLQFRNIEASVLEEQLSLTFDARDAVGDLPHNRTTVTVHKFIGGSVGGRATWSAWDNLSVNVEGGAAQQGVFSNGSIKLTIRTHWYWDFWGPNSDTWMQNEIHVTNSGDVSITGVYEGEP